MEGTVFTPPSCNILPKEVKPIRQLIAAHSKQDIAVTLTPEYSARDLLAANVGRLMQDHPDKGTAKKLAAAARWPASSGPKRRGRPLSERYIRYVLNPAPDAAHSPSLDIIQAIATAFDMQPWQLLVDDKQLRTWMVGKLFSASEAVSNAQVEKHYPLPPGETQRKGGTKGGEE